MKKQVAVIGLGRFGASLVQTLHGAGHEVLAIDKDEGKVQRIAASAAHAVQADATNESVLTELGLKDFEVAVVAMGSDIESSVLCTILLRKIGVTYIIARADHDLHGKILERIGANRVVYPEHEMGISVAHTVMLREVDDYMSLDPDYGISKLNSPKYLVGCTLEQLGFGPRGKSGVAILLLKRGEEIIVAPAMSEKVQVGDVLIPYGRDDQLEAMLNEARKNYPAENAEKQA
ncbi:MAG: TrkA family potassium uptake protein [Dehalococcoidia bacterium]|nr:TrkA family potassium uptake protein [Dehalococcoidia bacterium]